MALLGIDFGTASVRVAVAPQTGEPRVATVTTAPAVVSFNDGHVSTGDAVLMMAGVVPDLVVPGVKRLLGRDPTEEVVTRLAERCGFVATTRAGDLALAPAPEEVGVSGLVTVEHVVTSLLQYVVEEAAGGGAHQAVVAIPGWFGPLQRAALVRAAKRARIRILRFVQDVVAASLWAAHAHRVVGRVLAIDVGAGGVSGAVLDIGPRSVVLGRTGGSLSCGGDDLDAQLAATAIEAPTRRTRELARQACQALKRELASRESADKSLTVDGRTVQLSLQRWELDLMLGGVSQAIGEVAKQLLGGPSDATGELTRLLPFGGMTSLPGVLRELESLAEVPLDTQAPRLESAVLGAVRIGMALTGQRPIRHVVSDGESEETATDLTTPPADAREASGLVRGAPVVRKKAVLRQRPDVVRRRLDPKETRRGRGDSVRPESPAPSTAHDALDAEAERASAAEGPSAKASSAPPAAVDVADEIPRVLTTPERGRRLIPTSIPPAQPAARRSSVPTRAGPSAPPRTRDPRAPSVPPPAQRRPTVPPEAAPSPPVRAATTPPGGPRPSAAPPNPRADASGASAAAAPSLAAAADARVPSRPPARQPAIPPPPTEAPKYPARDGMPRFPPRDAALRAPAIPDTSPRRQANTQPSVRPPPPAAPTSSPPGDPLERLSDPGSQPPLRGATFPPPSYPPFTNPPAGAQMSIPPSALPTEGTIIGLTSAAQILAQPITAPLDPAALDPITLPVLLRRVLARTNVFGTCVIRTADFELRLDCEGGSASLTKSEYNDLIRAFELPRAEWRLSSTREEEPMREAVPLARLALEGLRRRLRELPTEDCERALADRLRLAPVIRADRTRIPKRLGLRGREQRFIESYFDGLQSAAELAGTGPLGPSTCFQLLILLELYGALEWNEVDA